MAGGNENGGRVTIRELYTALQDQNKARDDMKTEIMSKLENLPALVTQVSINTKEIEALRVNSNKWDKIIGTVTIVCSAVAAYLGINK